MCVPKNRGTPVGRRGFQFRARNRTTTTALARYPGLGTPRRNVIRDSSCISAVQ